METANHAKITAIPLAPESAPAEQGTGRAADTIALETVSRSLPPASSPDTGRLPKHKPSRARLAIIAVAIFAVSFLLNSFRTMQAVDLTSDETTYAIESVALGHTGITEWNGTPFFVHPPLFFISESLYYKALGIGNSPFFNRLLDRGYRSGEALLPAIAPLSADNMPRAIEFGRYLNAFYGAVLAMLVFLVGTALLDWRLGLLASAIFSLDPYVLWRNHFNYLEPLLTIFGVLTILTYYLAQREERTQQAAQEGANQQSLLPKRTRYLLLTGIFFGLAMLTKELALLYFAAIVAHWLLFRRKSPSSIVIPFTVGLAVYSLFPLWTALNGYFSIWFETKTWLLRRLSGQIVDSGLGRPGVSFFDTLAANLPDYWPWLLLLAITPVVTASFLFHYYRRGVRDPRAELLAGCVVGTYGFFVVVKLLGGVINEQYFYALMPFVALGLAYALFVAVRSHTSPTGPSRTILVSRVLPVALGGLLAYNGAAWVARYVFNSDDSYLQVDAKLANSLPPGTTVLGRDLLDLFLMPKQGVYTFGYLNLVGQYINPANVIDRKIPYAILNDQSLSQLYSGANPIYYGWVQSNGKAVEQFKGRIYGTQVYQLDYTRADQSFGANSLAAGRPAVASSTEDDPVYSARNAFDAKITTRWSSQTSDNEWIYVDLGQSRQFNQVELYWEDAFASGYQIQVSDDAQKWQSVYETNSGVGGVETIAAKGQGRYVRLLLTQRGTDFGYSLWEISIYP